MPRDATPLAPGLCLLPQAPASIRASKAVQTRAVLSRARGIGAQLYITLSKTSGGDAIRQQADGQAEEIGLVPTQDDPEILGRPVGRAVGAGWPDQSLTGSCRSAG